MKLATVRGTAADPTGALVPGVAVTLVNVNTNVARTATTDANGDFEISDLLNGTYRLSAKIAGFRTSVAENVILESGQTRRINVSLAVGDQVAEVTVRANAAVIETDSPTITGVLSSQRYDGTPLVANYFDPTLIMSSIAGVVAPTGGSYSLTFNGQNSSQLSEGMDGVSDDGPVNQINNMEDVQELTAVTNVASAEYSRAGNFNLIFKSGGNDLHGRAYYTHLNSALNARDFYEPEKTHSLMHTFGLDLSGPIKKNRVFYYGSWNAIRLPSKSFRTATVPTAKMREGDFSALLADSIVIKDAVTGTPYPNNVIPKSSFSSVSSKIQNLLLPSPNLGSADSLVDNYGWVHPRAEDAYRMDYLTQRIDYKVSDRNTLFGRLITRLTPYYLSGSLPDLAWTRKRHHHALILSDTHVIGSGIVNTARFGWLKDYYVDGDEVDGFTPVHGDEIVSAIGLLGVNPKGYKAQGAPSIALTGFAGIDVNPGGVIQDDRNLSYADTLTWVMGKHVLKFGGELKTFKSFGGAVPSGTYGSFSFNGGMTGFSYSDFLLGMPQSSYRLNSITNRTLGAKELGLFIEDSFKVNRRLNVYYGLRWDYFAAGQYDDGLVYNWDRSTGNVIVPQSAMNSISSLYPTDTIKVAAGEVVASPSRKNFRPRLGAAYRINDKTVVRAGYGSFSEQLGRFAMVQGGGPYQLGETFTNSIVSGAPLLAFPEPFPSLGHGKIASQSVSGFSVNASNGTIHEFNVSLEREVAQVGFRLSYVGSRDDGLHYSMNVNKPQPSLTAFAQSRRPYSQFVGTNVYMSNGESKYNALQIEAQRKVGSLVFDAHWTWASSMSNFLNLQNPYDANQWNRESAIPQHRAVFSVVYRLPVGKGQRLLSDAPRVVDQMLGGWSLSCLGYLQTGQFFSPTFSGSDPSNTNTFGGLPDRIGSGILSSDQRTLGRWFDTQAFTKPAAGHFGNSGANILEGPGYNAQHISLSKRFKLYERMSLEYVAAISNVFNHPNFQTPLSNISIPSQAGQIYSTVSTWDIQKGGPRQMEMKLRLEF
ncbi:MAG: carboxypeptidase-like regulatory domain-containing protein [Acidobacteriales bacterium]|nr:carboxypeptidase-like regulatory domain-containing protein [Terriglobales bacterium]